MCAMCMGIPSRAYVCTSPIKKCAEEFAATYGTDFEFTVGKAEKLISGITELKQGDILTCGAEFIFDEAQVKGLISGDKEERWL